MFIVIGTTGEYSDRTEWYVAAYWERKLAQKHADKARKRVAEIVAAGYDRWDTPKPENVWDPEWQHDYTGTDYVVAEVPLFEAVPAAKR